MSHSSKRSAYMEWAKTRSVARFNLATSGLTSVSIRDFPLHKPEMELTGSDGYGFQPLQERIAKHAGVPGQCVVAATGASMANYLAMSAILEPGDDVMIEHPGYGLFADIAHYLRARPINLSRPFDRQFGVRVEAIESGLTPKTRLIVLSNLHNPSGALLSEDTLRQIAEFAQPNGVHVLVDEVYLDMLFDPAAPSAFQLGQRLGLQANPFITTNSLTKTYGLSGLRCGWILAAPDLAFRMWGLNNLFGVNAVHMAEQMSAVAFDQLDALRRNAKERLGTNRVLLRHCLDAHPELECFWPPAGSVVFPRLSKGDPAAFLDLLRTKYETSVVPGEFFGLPQHFRVGIAGETTMVTAGLERLSAALDEFSSRV